MKLLPARITLPILLLSLALLGASCSTLAPSRANADAAPASDPVARNQAGLAAAPKKDKALWQYRLAAAALRQNRPDIAKPALDNALAASAANYGAPNPAAAKSRRLIKRESDKPFIGEPHERIMANYYRALLYWADGDLDNARALLRTAQLLDSDTINETRVNYCILLDYLDGLLAAKLTPQNPATGADALARARANAAAQDRPPLPDYDPAANLLIFVEYGDGPLKRAGGNDGEKLAYYLPAYPCSFAKLTINGLTTDLPPYDDIGLQAIIRESRLMDKILAQKNSLNKPFNATESGLSKAGAAVAKSDFWINGGDDSDSIGSAVGGVIVRAMLQYGLATTLAIASAPFHIVSGVITDKSQADTRCWDNLPRFLSFAALKLPSVAHEAELNFYDPLGRKYLTLTQHFTITIPAPAALPIGAAPKDVIIYRSQLRK